MSVVSRSIQGPLKELLVRDELSAEERAALSCLVADLEFENQLLRQRLEEAEAQVECANGEIQQLAAAQRNLLHQRASQAMASPGVQLAGDEHEDGEKQQPASTRLGSIARPHPSLAAMSQQLQAAQTAAVRERERTQSLQTAVEELAEQLRAACGERDELLARVNLAAMERAVEKSQQRALQEVNARGLSLQPAKHEDDVRRKRRPSMPAPTSHWQRRCDALESEVAALGQKLKSALAEACRLRQGQHQPRAGPRTSTALPRPADAPSAAADDSALALENQELRGRVEQLAAEMQLLRDHADRRKGQMRALSQHVDLLNSRERGGPPSQPRASPQALLSPRLNAIASPTQTAKARRPAAASPQHAVARRGGGGGSPELASEEAVETPVIDRGTQTERGLRASEDRDAGRAAAPPVAAQAPSQLLPRAWSDAALPGRAESPDTGLSAAAARRQAGSPDAAAADRPLNARPAAPAHAPSGDTDASDEQLHPAHASPEAPSLVETSNAHASVARGRLQVDVALDPLEAPMVDAAVEGLPLLPEAVFPAAVAAIGERAAASGEADEPRRDGSLQNVDGELLTHSMLLACTPAGCPRGSRSFIAEGEAIGAPSHPRPARPPSNPLCYSSSSAWIPVAAAAAAAPPDAPATSLALSHPPGDRPPPQAPNTAQPAASGHQGGLRADGRAGLPDQQSVLHASAPDADDCDFLLGPCQCPDARSLDDGLLSPAAKRIAHKAALLAGSPISIGEANPRASDTSSPPSLPATSLLTLPKHCVPGASASTAPSPPLQTHRVGESPAFADSTHLASSQSSGCVLGACTPSPPPSPGEASAARGAELSLGQPELGQTPLCTATGSAAASATPEAVEERPEGLTESPHAVTDENSHKNLTVASRGVVLAHVPADVTPPALDISSPVSFRPDDTLEGGRRSRAGAARSRPLAVGKNVMQDVLTPLQMLVDDTARHVEQSLRSRKGRTPVSAIVPPTPATAPPLGRPSANNNNNTPASTIPSIASAQRRSARQQAGDARVTPPSAVMRASHATVSDLWSRESTVWGTPELSSPYDLPPTLSPTEPAPLSPAAPRRSSPQGTVTLTLDVADLIASSPVFVLGAASASNKRSSPAVRPASGVDGVCAPRLDVELLRGEPSLAATPEMGSPMLSPLGGAFKENVADSMKRHLPADGGRSKGVEARPASPPSAATAPGSSRPPLQEGSESKNITLVAASPPPTAPSPPGATAASPPSPSRSRSSPVPAASSEEWPISHPVRRPLRPSARRSNSGPPAAADAKQPPQAGSKPTTALPRPSAPPAGPEPAPPPAVDAPPKTPQRAPPAAATGEHARSPGRLLPPAPTRTPPAKPAARKLLGIAIFDAPASGPEAAAKASTTALPHAPRMAKPAAGGGAQPRHDEGVRGARESTHAAFGRPPPSAAVQPVQQPKTRRMSLGPQQTLAGAQGDGGAAGASRIRRAHAAGPVAAERGAEGVSKSRAGARDDSDAARAPVRAAGGGRQRRQSMPFR